MRKRRALIFSDEVVIVYLFKNFFSSHGYEVFTFDEPDFCPVYRETGGTCAMAQPCADVIVSTVTFPRMNAVALLREQSRNGCRLDSRNKAFISGYADASHQKDIKELGSPVFHIPVDFTELSAWVEECEKRVDLSEPLSERRQEERRPCHKEISCKLDGEGAPVAGTAVNISDSGLCLRINVPLSVGQRIWISTDKPGAWRVARVMWVKKSENGSCLAGLFCD